MYPWDHVALDNCTIGINSAEGHTHILVLVDICTRFCILRALRSESAKEVAHELYTIFSVFGYPKILQSDNGAAFGAQVVDELLELMTVDKRRIAAYNPRSNGSAERYVGIIKKTLLKMLGNNLANWHLQLPMVAMAVNARCTSRHGSSPFELFFARPFSPLADHTGAESKLMTEEELITRNKKMLEIVYPKVNERVNGDNKMKDEVVNAQSSRRDTS